jgi:tetratricopeptide (TPR) repeat protein
LARLQRDDLEGRAASRRTLLAALFDIVAYHRYGGRLDRALEALDQAARSMSLGDVPAHTVVSYWGARTDVFMALPRPMSEAKACGRRALSLALGNGLLIDAALNAGNLCAIEVMRGDFEAAAAAGELGAGVCEYTAESEHTALLQLNRGRAEAARGRIRAARVFIADAKERAVESSVVTSLCDMYEAEIIVGGAANESDRLSASALDRMERFGAYRYVGAGLSVRAKVLDRLGRLPEAQTAARSAVDVLERHGTPYWLAQAYELSGRLTGNRRHRARARDVLAMIRA